MRGLGLRWFVGWLVLVEKKVSGLIERKGVGVGC